MPDNSRASSWLNLVKTDGCFDCHSSATRRPAPSRRRSATSRSSEDAWVRRIQSGQAGERHGQPSRPAIRRRTRQISRRLDRPHRPANCRAPSRRGRRASSATSSITMWDWADPKTYLHDQVVDRQAQSDRQRLRPAVRRDRGRAPTSAGVRSGDQQRDDRQAAGARRRHAGIARTDQCSDASRWRRRPIGATSRSGTPRPTSTT